MRERKGSGDTILGEIGVGRTHYVIRVELTGTDLNAQVLTRTKNIVLLDTKTQSDFFCTRKACA